MKKLMKKKVKLLGKEFSVFALVAVMMMTLASAALLPYFGQITGLVTVSQGLVLDGKSYDQAYIVESWAPFTSLEEKKYASLHTLTNGAETNANLKLALTRTATGGSDFYDIVTEYYVASQSSIIAGADRLVVTQNDDGTWEWNNPDTNKYNGPGPVNTYGVTAMGLLTAYEITGNQIYLDTAIITGNALISHFDLTNSVDISKRTNAFDVIFLYKLGEVSGIISYTDAAGKLLKNNLEENNYWTNNFGNACATNGCTAQNMFDGISNRRANDLGIILWDLAPWVEAANLGAKNTWATELKNIMDGQYASLDSNGDYYILGLAGVLDATGNNDAASELLATQQDDGSWDSNNIEGDVQDTAYAVMALMTKEGSENLYGAVMGAAWLKSVQDISNTNGGWENDEGAENTEITSEALWAVPVELLAPNAEFVISAKTESIFYIVNEFAQMLIPDTYEIATKVLPSL